jgi:hypothetical protein
MARKLNHKQRRFWERAIAGISEAIDSPIGHVVNLKLGRRLIAGIT